jgi:aryl-alcohol dehydrogenase-like predicted oxidoreductase
VKRRPLGRSAIEVAPLAFGANVFGWTVDEPTAFRLLDTFTDRGFNLVDTADVYSKWAPGNSGGESETVIGHWIGLGGGRREKIVLATKVGMEMPGGKKGLSRQYIAQAVEDSLKRLKTDRIDLYQAHAEDPDTPIDETMEAFSRLVRDGKVRAIGASNYSADSLAKADAAAKQGKWPRYETLQPQYNLYARQEYEEKLAPSCERLGVGVIAFWSLASGFLTGKYRTEADLAQSPRGAGIKAKYMNERGMKILDALDQVAKDKKAKCSQVALAWLMAQPTITAPIASATSIAQLRELMAAAELTLGKESLSLLDQASAY